MKLGSIIIKRKSLSTALRLVRHAVAKEKIRPILSGINIYSNSSEKSSTVDILGADGFRFVIYTAPAVIINGPLTGVFPLSLSSKLRQIKEEEVTIDILSIDKSRNMAWVNREEIELISTQYLNIRHLIPKTFSCKATFNVRDFKAALKVVQVIAKRGEGEIRLETKTENIMKIWAEFNEEIIIQEISAKVVGLGRLALHWKYLRDALDVGPDTIHFNPVVVSPSFVRSEPCVFTGIPNFMEAVMPMAFGFTDSTK